MLARSSPSFVKPAKRKWLDVYRSIRLEKGAYEYFRRIEEVGGVIEAIEDGFFVREIADSAEQYQREIETKDRITVGVNEYVSDDKLDIPLLEIDGEGERRHLKRLDSVRRERDTGRVTATLERLRQAAQGVENLMPSILDAVKAYATLGEMMQVLKDEWGEYQASRF